MENLNQIIKQFPEVGEVKEVKALTSADQPNLFSKNCRSPRS